MTGTLENMLQIQENESLGPKTTMRIGGEARWYTELLTKKDCEEAYAFARTKKCPLIVLGAGSNTIFADGTIEALVARIMAEEVKGEGTIVHVEAGKNLAQLVNELAQLSLDLSPLTGIPGTVGGAVFGNAGQGYGGIWMDRYIQSVETFSGGAWQTFERSELGFSYRHSPFKEMGAVIIWSVVLEAPSRPKAETQAEIQRLLRHRIETQPHVKTAGSCFLSISEDLPAWKLIDTAGLRGKKVGKVAISEKHANFLIAEKGATFNDTQTLVEEVRGAVSQPLTIEMRFIGENGKIIL